MAATNHAYRVVVTRDGDTWLADVPELEGAHITCARALARLDQAVREAIVLAADLPEEAVPELVINYEYRTGDPDADETAAAVRRLRRQADHLVAEAARRTADAARTLTDRGYSVRDVATLLGVSPQRVSQLTSHATRRAR